MFGLGHCCTSPPVFINVRHAAELMGSPEPYHHPSRLLAPAPRLIKLRISRGEPMKEMFRSTSGGKAGAVDGLNLFFGALLGANLGSIQGMTLPYYVELIFLLAAVVMTVRMLSTSPRRTYMLLSIALYVVIGAAFLLWKPLQPKGVAIADLQRLATTLGIWVVLVLGAELSPVRDLPET
jgi:hypothetical protein